MNNWKLEKLSNLCTKIGDGLHGTPTYDDKSDIYFINGNNLKNGWIEITKNTKRVSHEELLSNFIPLDENTLLLSINGTLGSMAFYRDEKVMLGKSSAYLNFKSSINKFYYYYFQLPFVQEYFYNVATGSTIKNLSLKSIQDFEVPVPAFNEWNSIVSVLSALDSKIELNNRINSELEAMAKTLYDYWFVQFDFPDKNGKPYKSSGGKMVWSEELKREVPNGWKVKTLADITSVSNESINPMDFPNKEFNYYSIPGFDESGTFQIERGYEIKSNKYTVTENDILVSKLNPWFSRVIYATTDVDLICSTEFVVWRTPSLELKNYLYMIARNSTFTTYCTKSASGTSNSHKRINPSVMMQYSIAFDESIALLYGKSIGSSVKLLAKNRIENKRLTDLRDWLLPMLMNGQVKLN